MGSSIRLAFARFFIAVAVAALAAFYIAMIIGLFQGAKLPAVAGIVSFVLFFVHVMGFMIWGRVLVFPEQDYAVGVALFFAGTWIPLLVPALLYKFTTHLDAVVVTDTTDGAHVTLVDSGEDLGRLKGLGVDNLEVGDRLQAYVGGPDFFTEPLHLPTLNQWLLVMVVGFIAAVAGVLVFFERAPRYETMDWPPAPPAPRPRYPYPSTGSASSPTYHGDRGGGSSYGYADSGGGYGGDGGGDGGGGGGGDGGGG